MDGYRSATFRQGMAPTLANDPRVIVMLLASASASGSWGLGGFFSVLLNPLWLLFLCCCCCACATAFARYLARFLSSSNRIYADRWFTEHVRLWSTRRSQLEGPSMARDIRQALVREAALVAARLGSSPVRSTCRQTAPGRVPRAPAAAREANINWF